MIFKNFLIPSFLYSFTILLFFTVAIYPQGTINPQIRVTGTSVIKVTPDLMKWNISVTTEDNDVEKAKRLNDASTAKVLNLLRELNIVQNTIQTSGIRVVKEKNYSDKEKQFTITNNIWFTNDVIGMYGDIATKLLKIDDVQINNIFLDYSKIIETRTKARLEALEAAKKKAEEMAAVYGMTIGKPLSVLEETYNTIYPNPFNSVSYDYNNSSSLSTFSEGSLNVGAMVYVTFELK